MGTPFTSSYCLSLRTADVFPVVASLPPTTGNTSAVRRLLPRMKRGNTSYIVIKKLCRKVACKAVFFRTVELLITAARLIHFDRRQLSLFKHLPLTDLPVSFRSTFPRGRIGLSNDTSQLQINQLGKV